jgi:hypothetical protein
MPPLPKSTAETQVILRVINSHSQVRRPALTEALLASLEPAFGPLIGIVPSGWGTAGPPGSGSEAMLDLDPSPGPGPVFRVQYSSHSSQASIA